MYIRVNDNLVPIPMGFASGGVWVMGYCGCMGYGMHFPANQLGGPKKVWNIGEYGLSRLWVTRESTVNSIAHAFKFRLFQSSFMGSFGKVWEIGLVFREYEISLMFL
jgi:hypothetical protein